MQASSPTWVCGATRLRFPGWSCTLPLTVGADSISARGCLPRRRVRRDEGIPPYDRPGGCSPFRFGGAFRKVCRGGIYPARGLAATQGPRDDLRPKSRACGPVGLRNAPAGAVRASSPTGERRGGGHFPGWPPCLPGPVGRAFTPAAHWQFQKMAPCAAAGCGGMRASRPTAARAVAAIRSRPPHIAQTPPSVAAMTALIVCMRLPASANTSDCGPSNTSSVTSMASRPNFSPISLPTAVLWSW